MFDFPKRLVELLHGSVSWKFFALFAITFLIWGLMSAAPQQERMQRRLTFRSPEIDWKRVVLALAAGACGYCAYAYYPRFETYSVMATLHPDDSVTVKLKENGVW